MSDREAALLEYMRWRDERRRMFWIWGSIVAIVLGSVGVGGFFAIKARHDADRKQQEEVHKYTCALAQDQGLDFSDC